MPELPEVETLRRGLAETLAERCIVAVDVRRALSVGLGTSPAGQGVVEMQNRCRDRHFDRFNRHGKYLQIGLDSGDTLLIHLRMSGRLIHVAAGDTLPLHTHVIVRLDDGTELRFIDPRTFGSIRLLRKDEVATHPSLTVLGPDALSPDFTLDHLRRRFARCRSTVKVRLLDQGVVAGIGNIYAAEICHQAQIHPAKRCDLLGHKQLAALHTAILEVLIEAIAHHGTTFADYRTWDGEWGGHQDHLQVFRREGESCRRCGGAIRRIVQCGRSTYFCPGCQKK